MENNNIENNNGSHEHSLKNILLNDICVFCCYHIFNKMGYICESCDLVLCENCYEKIYIYDVNNFHRHNLILKFREEWFCNICKQCYKNKYSCFCESCDFDVCYKCYYNSDKKGEKDNDNDNDNNNNNNNNNDNNNDNDLDEVFNEMEKAGKMMDNCIQQ